MCQMCKLDCHSLVQALQAVRRGPDGWEARRRLVVSRLAPGLLTKRCATWLERLVATPTEGMAWHAGGDCYSLLSVASCDYTCITDKGHLQPCFACG